MQKNWMNKNGLIWAPGTANDIEQWGYQQTLKYIERELEIDCVLCNNNNKKVFKRSEMLSEWTLCV